MIESEYSILQVVYFVELNIKTFQKLPFIESHRGFLWNYHWTTWKTSTDWTFNFDTVVFLQTRSCLRDSNYCNNTLEKLGFGSTDFSKTTLAQ